MVHGRWPSWRLIRLTMPDGSEGSPLTIAAHDKVRGLRSLLLDSSTDKMEFAWIMQRDLQVMHPHCAGGLAALFGARLACVHVVAFTFDI